MGLWKDTVPTDEEDDEVDADQHAGEGRPTIRHDAVVHHRVPVLSCQDLWRDKWVLFIGGPLSHEENATVI